VGCLIFLIYIAGCPIILYSLFTWAGFVNISGPNRDKIITGLSAFIFALIMVEYP
jgi:hypothetical protein